jgi:hypothetical protein
MNRKDRMSSTGTYVYEVTTSTGHKQRIRAAGFDIADEIVVFDAKKGGKSKVAAFPVSQLDSVVRADISSPSGSSASRSKTRPKARSRVKTSAPAVTPRRSQSSNAKSATKSSNAKARNRATARSAR